jgi:hypothetical protein
MSESRWHKLLSGAGLGVAVVLLVTGSRRMHEVEPSPDVVSAVEKPSANPFEVPSFAPRPEIPPPPPPPEAVPSTANLSDLGLIENATFTGVIRKEGHLYYTYDPAKKRGKRSCPT